MVCVADEEDLADRPDVADFACGVEVVDADVPPPDDCAGDADPPQPVSVTAASVVSTTDVRMVCSFIAMPLGSVGTGICRAR